MTPYNEQAITSMVPLKGASPFDDEYNNQSNQNFLGKNSHLHDELEQRYEPEDSEELDGYGDEEPDYEKFNDSWTGNRSSRLQNQSSTTSNSNINDNINNISNTSKNHSEHLSSSADDIDDDYLEDSAMSIDNHNAGAELELDNIDNVHDFESNDDSEDSPVKETSFTNKSSSPLTSFLSSSSLSNTRSHSSTTLKNQRGYKHINYRSDNNSKAFSENVPPKQDAGNYLSKNELRKSSQRTNYQLKPTSNSRLKQQRQSFESEGESDEDSDDYDDDDEKRSSGISRGISSWINKQLVCIVKTIYNIFYSFFEFFSKFSPKALLISSVLFGILSLVLFSFVDMSPTTSLNSLFIQPSGMPSDIGTLIGRLMNVESEVSKLSRQALNSEHAGYALQQYLTALQTQLADVSKDMSKFEKKIDYVGASALRNDGTLNEVERTLEQIEEKLFGTHELIQEERRRGKIRERDIGDAQRRMADISTAVQDFSTEIETLKSRVNHLEQDAEKIEDIVIKSIDKVLPPRLVVSVDSSTGEIKPTPEFWQFLQATFYSFVDDDDESGRFERKIKQIVEKHPELMPQLSSNNNHYNNDAAGQDFHEYTQKAIKNYFEEYIKKGKESLHGNAIVTRDVFTQLIRKEVESMREFTMTSLASLERKYKEKLAQQSSRFRKGKEGATSTNESIRNKVLMDGTSLTLDNLIKKSIEKYIFHTISKPDFADPAFGARVNTKLTSPLYDWNFNLSFLDRQWRKSLNKMGFGHTKVNPPSMAFNNDVKPGSCWPFNGHSGHVALSLGSSINPTDLGIVHINADQSTKPTSAPRRVSLWVEVKDPELRKQVCLLVDQSPVSKAEQGQGHGFLGLLSQQKQTFKPPPNYVKVLTAEYDLLGDEEFQVFPVSEVVQQLGIETKNVLFNIESNWGYPDYTCVYRLRLFGEDISRPVVEETLEKVLEPETLINNGEEDDDDGQEYNNFGFVVGNGNSIVYNGGVPVEEEVYDKGDQINEFVNPSNDETPVKVPVDQLKIREKGKVLVKGSLHEYNFDPEYDSF